jgi:hypothetical protein
MYLCLLLERFIILSLLLLQQVKSIYVGNLPESATEEKLTEIFKAHGEV